MFIFPFLCNLILFYYRDDSRILLFPLMLDNRLCLDILFYVNLMDPFNLQTKILLFFFQYVLKYFSFPFIGFHPSEIPIFPSSIIFLLIILNSVSSLCFCHNYFKHFLHASDLICSSVFLDSNLSVRFIRVLLKFSVCLLNSKHFFSVVLSLSSHLWNSWGFFR